MELHSINCCFDIYSFKVPMKIMKINKNTANAYTY